jgi:hypothetical protein
VIVAVSAVLRYRDGEMTAVGHSGAGSEAHFSCPFCNSHEVDRLYLASLRLDSCACLSCGARWDEDADSGAFRGRGSRSSILAPRNR